MDGTMPGKSIDSFVPWDACVTRNVGNERRIKTIGKQHRRQSEVEADESVVGTTSMNAIERIDRDKRIGVNERRDTNIMSEQPNLRTGNGT